MNFDDIKKEMNESIDQLPKDEFKIDLSKGKNNPVDMIRRNMKKEMISSSIAMLFFVFYPPILGLKMTALENSAYILFMVLSTVMIHLYIIKLIRFLKKSSRFELNTKDSIKDYIYEVRLTLESYKSYVIAAMILLPVPIYALLSAGSPLNGPKSLNFEKWYTLQLNFNEAVMLIVFYLIYSVAMVWVTRFWTNYLYGKHVTELEKIVSDLDAVD